MEYVKFLESHLGLSEIKGGQHQPVLMNMLDKMGGFNGESKAWYRDDETPWCGLAVGYALGQAGKWVVHNWFRAKAWADSEAMTKLTKPCVGAIVVFDRKGGGHVGFVVGKDAAGHLIVLGGNQSDKVTYAAFGLDRVAGYWYPSDNIGGQPIKREPPQEAYNLPLMKAGISKRED